VALHGVRGVGTASGRALCNSSEQVRKKQVFYFIFYIARRAEEHYVIAVNMFAENSFFLVCKLGIL
jgi:hypothetical protein